MIQIDLKTMCEEVVHGPLAIAIGNFDGVHIGHQALLRRLVAEGEALRQTTSGLRTAVWCFGEPPSAYLPGATSPQLSTNEQKLALFAAAGVDACILGDFPTLCDYPPKRFVQEILLEQCDCRFIVCGFNFSFGARGAGRADDLLRLFSGRCAVVPPVRLGETTVSSTAIRAALKKGDVDLARQMLGRPYSVSLPVLHGKAFGRTIGVPTINQRFPAGHMIPAYGVYATVAEVDGQLFPAVTNVGVRPTVEHDSAVNCESHLLDVQADLYGRTVQIRFYRYLRSEQRFSSVDALREAIAGDIAAVRACFAENAAALCRTGEGI